MCLCSKLYKGPDRKVGSQVYKLVNRVFGGVLETPWKRVTIELNKTQWRGSAAPISYKYGSYPEGIHVFPTRAAARKYKLNTSSLKILQGKLVGEVVFRGSQRRYTNLVLVPVLVVTAVGWERVVR